MEYKLLAADMDGTALNDNKDLSPRTVRAMEKAIEQGKIVVFSTGRGITIVQPYIDMVRGMRYAITSSGAAVIDLETGERLVHKKIDEETVKMIIAQVSGRYVMPIIYNDDASYSTAWCVDCIEEFGHKTYEPIYRQCLTIVDDAFNAFMENPRPIEKLNLFFDDDNEAQEVYESIKNLPITFTGKTARAFEINAQGVSKAEGLKVLCERLGIAPSECIAVGDSKNDEEILACAGLKVAMANGSDRVKALADVVCADCNNDGVAAIIEEYLLA